ncbi:diguanylate cyclase domain-containing protein [Phormidium sp. CCY1219]|uniref:diguanylate cyclase domain-containing protein n=1 Tax=Phormidium sp. CCY1219 TaxID=2886104 RepID=UPI002D1ECBC5|nr:diguanylate cyclase [Phormidium sp. CCY1219]MEB3828353.1 diguanylate cyclase [Phormidium sp. CCY1219]
MQPRQKRSPLDRDFQYHNSDGCGCEYAQGEEKRLQFCQELCNRPASLSDYRHLCETLSSFYFILDKQGAIASVSAIADRRLGNSGQGASDRCFLHLIHPEDRESAYIALWQPADKSACENPSSPHLSFLPTPLGRPWEGRLLASNQASVWVRIRLYQLPSGDNLPPTELSLSNQAKITSLSPIQSEASSLVKTPLPSPHLDLNQFLGKSQNNHCLFCSPLFLFACEDISEVKNYKKQLEEQRQFVGKVLEATDILVRNFVTTVLDTTNSLVVVLDPEAKVVSCNHACETVTGYSFEEISNQVVWDLFLLEEEVESFQEVLSALSAGEFPLQHETTWLTRQGERRIICWSMTAIFEMDNQLKYIICTGIDMTERRQAEKALRLSEERLRTQYKSLPIPTFTWQQVRESFVLIDYNDAAAEISQGDLHRFQGKTAELLYPERPEMVQQLWQCYEEKATVKGEMLYRFPATEQPKYFALTYVFVAPDMVMVHKEDITERKQLVVTLKQQAQRERLIGRIQARIRQSLQLDEILKTAVAEVRGFLQAQRVAIYQLNNSKEGENVGCGGGFVVESRESSCSSLMEVSPPQTDFVETFGGGFREGEVGAIADIETAGLDELHKRQMQAADIRAHLQVPILIREPDNSGAEVGGRSPIQLWGWLCADSCSEVRQWQTGEIEVLQQLTVELAIAIQQAQLYQQLQLANQELHRLATVDELTRVANRRHFDAYLMQQWQELSHGQIPLSLILCDIDYFKPYNDFYGHPAGDRTLQQVAGAIAQEDRNTGELVARYGGEEFVVVLPNTALADAVKKAQEIRQRVRSLAIAHDASPIHGIVTLSLGVATLIPDPTRPPDRLIAAADGALYRAKENGRDRVEVASLEADNPHSARQWTLEFKA